MSQFAKECQRIDEAFQSFHQSELPKMDATVGNFLETVCRRAFVAGILFAAKRTEDKCGKPIGDEKE